MTKRSSGQCDACERYFVELGLPCSAVLGECDCPRCQGLCECEIPLDVEEKGFVRKLADKLMGGDE